MKSDKAIYCGGILFGTHYFYGPNFEVGGRADYRLRNPMAKKMSVEELQDMATQLISSAHASGQVIEIEHIGIPQYGMGGYAPAVKLRPNYEKVREAMDELQARRDGTSMPSRSLKTGPDQPQRLLKARNIPWDSGDKTLDDAVQQDPSHLTHQTLVSLVREYDRRLMQLWDKIGFERQKDLVDYNRLNTQLVQNVIPAYPGINDTIADQKDYQLSVFESRYSHGVIAMIGFDPQIAAIVQDLFQGSDDDNNYIWKLLSFEWYPIAAGKDASEALTKLDTKMQKVPVKTTNELLLHWLDYVQAINDRIKDEKVYEIVHAQFEDYVEAAYASRA